MRTTIGEVISRVRNQIKAVKQDAFLTDRFIYSVISKHVKWIIKREDAGNKLMRFNSIFQTMDYVELIEIDKVEAQCTGIKSDCTFMRTKDKLPVFLQGYWGPLIRTVSSLDGSVEMQPTTPSGYLSAANSKNFKYNTTQYFWYLNDYLYFPNTDWDAVRIEGVFEDDIADFRCDPSELCKPKQMQFFNVPDYLYAEMETAVLKDMLMMYQIPTDVIPDKQNLLR
jgi:hypothetical protein